MKRNTNYLSKLTKFKLEIQSLFDISSCKCKIIQNCVCPKHNKIPVQEQEFLCDQRNDRIMSIGKVDNKETKKIKQREERKAKVIKINFMFLMSNKNITDKNNANFIQVDNKKPCTSTCTSKNIDDREKPSTSNIIEDESDSSIRQNRIKLETVAKTSDRYGLSDRSAAAITTMYVGR